MADDPTRATELPPRHDWEEPPAAGWASSLPDVARELGWLCATAGLALGATRAVHKAREMGVHEQHGLRHVLVISLWLGACLAAALMAVYVWRRLGGFALVAAMLTDYGRIRRMGGRPPVWLDAPPPDGLRLVHLSDLHVAEGPTVRMIERLRPAGNRVLERLLDAPALDGSDVILITGDVTDRGTAVSWRCFRDAVEERDLGDRVILVPGNHDLAFVDGLHKRWATRLDRFGVVQLANLLKFGEVFADTLGGRRGLVLVDGEVRTYAEAWAEAERAVRPLVAALPTLPVPPLSLRRYFAERPAFSDYVERIEAARARLLELFPVAVPLPERDAVVFVLNSVSRVSRHPALNAIGRIGRAQYRRLEKLARARKEPLKLVAVHHHLVRRAEEQSSSLKLRLFAKFTVLGDPRPLARFCERYQVRAVLNGHRHLSYQLRLSGGTVILAAPSSTMGDELAKDPRPQLERYQFAPAAERGTVGIFREPVRLPLEEAEAAPAVTAEPASAI